MSNENGRLPPDTAGGVALDAAIYATKIKSLLDDAHAMPRGRCPDLVPELMQFSHPRGCDPSMVDADPVKNRYSTAYWNIVRSLRGLGVDESDGEFFVEEIGKGIDPKGQIVAQFVLAWRPSVPDRAIPTGPTLVKP